MKTFDSPEDKTIAKKQADRKSEGDRYWQTAGDRVLLYLRCLNFPAPQALELALGALKAAERNMNLASGNSPVVEAMQALYQLLRERRPGMPGQNYSPAAWCGGLKPPLPPLQRLPMVPEGMASARWRSLFTNLWNHFKRSRSRRQDY